MEITSLRKEHIPAAARLFIDAYRRERTGAPLLSERMLDPALVAGLLENLLAHSAGLAALEGGRLVGCLGWWLVDGFRDTPRKGAYCPEWAHGALPGQEGRVYRALYRAAARIWLEAGCRVHAITLLAHEQAALDAWFWNGFGLTCVDALRPIDGPARPRSLDEDRPDLSDTGELHFLETGTAPFLDTGSLRPVRETETANAAEHLLPGPTAALPAILPLPAQIPDGYIIRKAALADAPALAALEAEHWRHYAEPPTLMVACNPSSEEEMAALVEMPGSSAWMALQNGEPAGYLRFENRIDGAAEVVYDARTTGITGAFVRPAHRGRGLAPAILAAALRDYAACGYTRCATDFESFNPEAATFWTKYFQPVALSVVRVPEREQ